MRNLNTGVARRDDSLILPEELRAIDTTLREGVDLEAMIARQVLGLETKYHPAIQEIEFQRVTREGAARVFNALMTDDVPYVDLHTTPHTHKIKSIVIGFPIYKHERDAADLTGRDIVGQKTVGAHRAATILENDIFWNGLDANNILGVLSYTGIQTYTVALNAGGTSRTWANKTAAEILTDITDVWALVNLKDNYHASMAVFNTTDTKYLHLPYSATVPTSVWQIVQDAGWFPAGMLTSEKIPSGTFVVLQNTRDVGVNALPQDLTRQLPVRLGSFKEEVAFEERYGGALLYRPLGVCVATGIA